MIDYIMSVKWLKSGLRHYTFETFPPFEVLGGTICMVCPDRGSPSFDEIPRELDRLKRDASGKAMFFGAGATLQLGETAIHVTREFQNPDDWSELSHFIIPRDLFEEAFGEWRVFLLRNDI